MSVLTVFRTHPLIHVSYLIALIPGIVLIANGAVPITLLVAYAAVVAFEHSNTNLGFGPLGTHFCEPELSPHSPQIGRAPGREPRLRADDLGSDGSPGSISDAGDNPGRHRSPGPTARWSNRRLTDHVTSRCSLPNSSGRSAPLTLRKGLVPDCPDAPRSVRAKRVRRLVWPLFRTGPTAPALDVALIPVRIVLAWIFIYYGAGKLFGAFNGPGIHRTALYLSNTAHLRPGGLFAVLGGVIEFGGGIAVALGLGSRLADSRCLGTRSWR